MKLVDNITGSINAFVHHDVQDMSVAGSGHARGSISKGTAITSSGIGPWWQVAMHLMVNVPGGGVVA